VTQEEFEMRIDGVHVLLSYTCLYECDHCFAWGSPRQEGTLSMAGLHEILRQARELGTVNWFFFEGGEPFLFYPVLRSAVEKAAGAGFDVGLVSNAYWATEVEDAVEWLRPFAGIVGDLSISSDDYHGGSNHARRAGNALEAAQRLEIPASIIAVAQPGDLEATISIGTLEGDCAAVMYRGRAAEALADRVPWPAWERYEECPHEDLRSPGRIHIDPLGNVHVCQGISLGNVFQGPLKELCEGYDPDGHPIVGPLLSGGPAELCRRYGLDLGAGAADACHLCYLARVALRDRFPDVLTPDQMYGVVDEG
jgi:MoaA/NifB/PqqE/SkfB family radical SAM enzyme